MHGEIDASGGEGFLDLLDEDAFSVEAGRRDEAGLLHPIAGGADDLDFDGVAVNAELLRDVVSLPESELGASGTDADLGHDSLRIRQNVDRSGLRQINMEAGSHAAGEIAALGMDAAAVGLDQFAGDPQADAGADILLGGKEGVEDAVEFRGGDAAAIVLDDQAGVSGGCGDLDSDARAGDVEGVHGVGDEVGEDLAQLVGTMRTWTPGW